MALGVKVLFLRQAAVRSGWLLGEVSEIRSYGVHGCGGRRGGMCWHRS